MPSKSEEEMYLSPSQREKLPYGLKQAIINKKKGKSGKMKTLPVKMKSEKVMPVKMEKGKLYQK